MGLLILYIEIAKYGCNEEEEEELLKKKWGKNDEDCTNT